MQVQGSSLTLSGLVYSNILLLPAVTGKPQLVLKQYFLIIGFGTSVSRNAPTISAL